MSDNDLESQNTKVRAFLKLDPSEHCPARMVAGTCTRLVYDFLVFADCWATPNELTRDDALWDS